MSRIAYVNGRYRPLDRATVNVEDRGLQFADGVYEVIKTIDGVPRDLERHLDRLERSLRELRIEAPVTRPALRQIIGRIVARSGLRSPNIYVQINRGAAPRNHPFPKGAKPSLIVVGRRAHRPAASDLERGVGVITLPDPRWARCDIKSVSLLPNVLARQHAAERGCREAWLLDRDGCITEGSTSNAYIVDRDLRVVTRDLGPELLGGVTRAVVLELAREAAIEVALRPFSVEEARAAREAFITSTSAMVLPVTTLDGRPIGDGRPGAVTLRLLNLYRARYGLPEHRAATS